MRCVRFRFLQLFLAFTLLLPAVAFARTGQSAPTVGTWDTRASSLNFSYLEGFFSGGHLRFASYFTNFSSTTGRLSSQFGLHYVGYGEGTSAAHGMAGSVTAMYQMPLSGRQPNGLPWVALAPYAGVSPSGIVSGDFAAIALPMHVGVGVPVSPVSWLTLTPWGEVTVGLDMDLDISRQAINALASGTTKPSDAKVTDFVQFNYAMHLASRVGLNAAFHLGKRVDIQLQGLGNWLSRPTSTSAFVFMAGGALVWHWDDVVPAVLPNDGCPMPDAGTDTSAAL